MQKENMNIIGKETAMKNKQVEGSVVISEDIQRPAYRMGKNVLRIPHIFLYLLTEATEAISRN